MQNLKSFFQAYKSYTLTDRQRDIWKHYLHAVQSVIMYKLGKMPTRFLVSISLQVILIQETDLFYGHLKNSWISIT